MSVVALPRRTPAAGVAPLPMDRLERVWAWGRADSAMSWVWRPTTVDGVRDVLALAAARGLGVGLRGAGCSYGDASLNAEGVSLDLSRMNRILEWNPATGVIRVEPGVTIRQLWQYVLEDGWWPPVVTGTMAITLGGAAGMNVHGKNAWKLGPIGDHLRSVDLLLASGEVVRCSRDERPELFHAAIGGFGMLGCFTSLELQLERIHSGLIEIEAIPARSLREQLRDLRGAPRHRGLSRRVGRHVRPRRRARARARARRLSPAARRGPARRADAAPAAPGAAADPLRRGAEVADVAVHAAAHQRHGRPAGEHRQVPAERAAGSPALSPVARRLPLPAGLRARLEARVRARRACPVPGLRPGGDGTGDVQRAARDGRTGPGSCPTSASSSAIAPTPSG